MRGADWQAAPFRAAFLARRSRLPVSPSPTLEDLIVLYLPDASEWHRLCGSMLDAGFAEVASFNPYWQQRGRTFEDHDRYRIVLEQASWSNGDGVQVNPMV
jgi:hypothetical protein